MIATHYMCRDAFPPDFFLYARIGKISGKQISMRVMRRNAYWCGFRTTSSATHVTHVTHATQGSICPSRTEFGHGDGLARRRRPDRLADWPGDRHDHYGLRGSSRPTRRAAPAYNQQLRRGCASASANSPSARTFSANPPLTRGGEKWWCRPWGSA